MNILTSLELEELVEHLSARPDIWRKHGRAWLRVLKSSDEEPQVALGFVVQPAPEEGLYYLIAKNVLWSENGTHEYVEWLLDKYTAYTMRQKIISLLAAAVKPTTNIQLLSRDLCDFHGGVFVRRRERNVETSSPPEHQEVP